MGYCVLTIFLETAVYGTTQTVSQPLSLSTDQTSCIMQLSNVSRGFHACMNVLVAKIASKA